MPGKGADIGFLLFFHVIIFLLGKFLIEYNAIWSSHRVPGIFTYSYVYSNWTTKIK